MKICEQILKKHSGKNSGNDSKETKNNHSSQFMEKLAPKNSLHQKYELKKNFLYYTEKAKVKFRLANIAL